MNSNNPQGLTSETPVDGSQEGSRCDRRKNPFRPQNSRTAGYFLFNLPFRPTAAGIKPHLLNYKDQGMNGEESL